MPNVKLFADHLLLHDCGQSLENRLPALRDLLCDRLGVTLSACHIVVIPVRALQDQPPVNVELHILPRPERTTGRIREICAEIKDIVSDVTGKPTAVRCAMLDPLTYVALK